MFTKKDLLKLWEVGSATVRKSLERIESVANELTDEVNLIITIYVSRDLLFAGG